MSWTGVHLAIAHPNMPQQQIVALNFCPNCWELSDIRRLYYGLPGMVEREADLIQADFKRRERISTRDAMEHYQYPGTEEANAVQNNTESGEPPEDGGDPV